MIRVKRMTFPAILSGFIIISLASCDSTKKYERQEVEELNNYLANNPTLLFERKPSGLYYLEVVTGTGLTVAAHDSVYLFYSAKGLDGTEYYTNMGTADTVIFPIGEGYLIKGLEEGITYMREGGESMFLMTSKLAYGSTGNNYNIQAFTPLVFDISLVRVKPVPGKK